MPEFDFEASRDFFKRASFSFGRANGKHLLAMHIVAAIFALDKRVKKKPRPHKVDGDFLKIGKGYFKKNVTVYICPDCGAFISRANNCCHDCGQAIDWS